GFVTVWLSGLTGQAQAGIVLSNDASLGAASLDAGTSIGTATLGAPLHDREVGSDDDGSVPDAERLDAVGVLEAGLGGSVPAGGAGNSGTGTSSSGTGGSNASFLARIGEVPTQASDSLIGRLVTFSQALLPTPSEGRLFRPPRACEA
ncbi:MAG TPA: hypothetical protein VGX78_20070, partial [Pirellulales bacterium]|nr:hypothetical protein [Pirellulales bacterium]